MITGEYWKLHDDATLRKLDAAAVGLLETGGVRVHHEGLLKQLEGAGCRVAWNEGRAYIPERLIREALSALGARPGETVQIPVGFNPQRHMTHGGSHPHILEWPSCRRRLATRKDARDMAMMAHVLEEFESVGKVLTCCEVDQRVEPLWAALEMSQITNKPIYGGEILHAEYIEPLVRMGEVLSARPGDTRLVAACDFFIPPLIFDRQQAECFLEKRRFGMPNVPGSMPVSGLSGPVTIAGTVTIVLAELLAGWVFGYVVRPDLPARGIAASGSFDMKSACVSFGSPEALLQDAAAVQVCRRLYGIPVWAATTYVDCKRPGLEATFQKMLPLVSMAFGTGHSVGGDGLLSAGQDYSPVQQMLDHEMTKAVERFLGHYEVTDETVTTDLILQVMRAETASFLEASHTAQHYRREQWYPRWFDRSLWRADEIERDSEHRMLSAIDRYCRDAIAQYEPPDLDQACIRELRRIYEAAERSLLR